MSDHMESSEEEAKEKEQCDQMKKSEKKCPGEDFDDDSSNSSSSESRPTFLMERDSSGSDSDYHRYMKSNFITEVYHAKDYDYSTNDDMSNISGSQFSRATSRSSSFTSANGDFMDEYRDGTGGIMAADDKYHENSSPTNSSSSSSEEHKHRQRPQRLSRAQTKKIQEENAYSTVSRTSIDNDDDFEDEKSRECVKDEKKTDEDSHLPDRKIKEKQSSITSTCTYDGSVEDEHERPIKPPKPTKQSEIKEPTKASVVDVSAGNESTFKPLDITVTSNERSLVTSGVKDSFYLDGDNRYLITSPTVLLPSTTREHEDMFLSKYIPSPKRNVKSLSWHISITDNSGSNNGYQLRIYKVLLRRSKSWCGGNNWALFIDGKHVANGKVPIFTMSSEISFELPEPVVSSGDSTTGSERQKAKIEIRRVAWYRRKLKYKFKIDGNEYPTYYAQPVDLFQSSSPTTTTDSSDTSSNSITESVSEKLPSPDKNSTTNSSSSNNSGAVAKRGSSNIHTSKALSSAASTLKSSAHPPKPRLSTPRIFSPAQMVITIPSTNTEISASGKQKIYYQILIRIPALPQPIVVERRYKHFAQLSHLLRGELSLTLEEKLQGGASKARDKEDKSTLQSCHTKLNQFPSLPPRVYNPMVNQLKPDFIKARRLALQSFLIELMAYDPKIVHCSEFLGFLGLHPITCTSMLKS